MMGKLETLPVAPSAPAVLRFLGRYDRRKVEAFIEVAIGLLDTLDAPVDPDEPDYTTRTDGMPGDPIDHEQAGDDEAGAYVEWTSTTAPIRKAGKCLITPPGPCWSRATEDDEDDDRDTSVEDGPNGFDPEEDHGIDDVAHDEQHHQIPVYGIDQTKG